MTWVAVPVSPEEVTAEYLYDLGRRHKIMPENTALAVENCRAVACNCAVIQVVDEESKDTVAHLIVSEIVDGEAATIDFVPVGKFFSPVGKDGNRNTEPFLEKISSALTPIFRSLIEGRNLRRLTAVVPKTHTRAARALRECGFKKEGVMRDAVKFRGKGVEDLVMMGMLADKE